MKTEELKTLKDIAITCRSDESYRDDLKAEAVKWVKELKKQDEEMKDTQNEISIAHFMDFFNLTEKDLEDLKEKEEKAAQNDFRADSEKKKDNHSPQESKVGSATEGSAEFKDKEPENKSSNESLQTSFMGSGSDIQSSKIFEDVINELTKIQLCLQSDDDEDWDVALSRVKNLKSKIKEKWGKI